MPETLRPTSLHSTRQRYRSTVAPLSQGSNQPWHADYKAAIVHVPPERLHFGESRLIKNLEALTQAALAVAGQCGPLVPIYAKVDGTIIAGEEWFNAYKELGLGTVPVIFVDHLPTGKIRALRLTLRRIGQMAIFDEQELASELSGLLRLDPDLIRMTPWSMPEVDRDIAKALLSQTPSGTDVLPPDLPRLVSTPGCLWAFADGNRLLHGDARKAEQVARLFDGAKADFVCTDPPYGIRIADVVSRRHGEFVQGSDVGEDEIRALFVDFLRALLPHVKNGCMADVFIDHRSMFALMQAMRETGLHFITICVWDKQSGGMGSPFRNQAEYILVAKIGDAQPIDNIQLGRYDRNRTTLWRAPGYAGFGRDRADALARHPTSKPVALIADAILDFSHRGHIVFDPFSGSGTTLLAAHQTGRRCYGIELDGKYVDMAVRRMQAKTGEPAKLSGTSITFDEIAARIDAQPTSAAPTRSRYRPTRETANDASRPEAVDEDSR